MRDAAAFAREQERLARVWTFLGLVRDLPKDGDWFTASLATRSVFVQRFGEDIRAFENICPHRFYPLRIGRSGNGPLVCGFHHWQFNRDGLAVGVPVCREVFGVLPHELGARLNPVEVAICGQLIFGRFATEERKESLDEYLGDGFPIIAAMSAMQSRSRTVTESVAANWRLLYHISLDDYHGVAIHPTTFGRTGHVQRQRISYFQFGLHSAFLDTDDQGAFAAMAQGCRDGSFRAERYSIFQIFPNLLMVLLRSDRHFWFCIIQQYVPVAPDRTFVRNWLYASPFPDDHDRRPRWLKPTLDAVRRQIFLRYLRRVIGEDHRACERIQSIIEQVDGAPMLGALEERIAWFETAYRQVVSH
jgi:phenylpropionate dioxygenase-like ring-hydroxylating dioxygenase large terminal subunit